MSEFEVVHADCLAVLRTLAADSIDAIVTDPPAGISFMGKAWDDDKGGRRQWTAWLTEVMRECLRVLKPGGHALVWALPRTSHWTATAIEDAGFEIRDRVSHLFGTGFPKSLDVSKAIDAAAGAKREVVGTKIGLPGYSLKRQGAGGFLSGRADGSLDNADGECAITAPATDDAKKWDGFGTALKPACEDWWLARKPLVGTVAQNVLMHGTGALNVDGCRIASATPGRCREGEPSQERRYADRGATNFAATPGPRGGAPEGRWPAHLVLSHNAECGETCVESCPVRMLDEQSGVLKSGARKGFYPTAPSPVYGVYNGVSKEVAGSEGGASRFFYVAKGSTSEKAAGLEGRNTHPTVKSIALMRWLCRLITPPGGTILDPFCGSGTTGCAAMLEGFDFLGVEQDAGYADIARARIAHWLREGA